MLIVKAEACASDDIRDVSREAVELAGRIGAVVEISFNGVVLWARPDDAEDTLRMSPDFKGGNRAS